MPHGSPRIRANTEACRLLIQYFGVAGINAVYDKIKSFGKGGLKKTLYIFQPVNVCIFAST